MEIVFVVVAAVVVFAVAAAAVGRGDGLEEPLTDLARPYLPDGRLVPADVDGVHFAVAFRGYRMDQVDSVLDRLSEEIVARDQRITALERIVRVQTVQSAAGHGAAPTRAGRKVRAEPYPPPQQPPGESSPGDDTAQWSAGDDTARWSPGEDTAQWSPGDDTDPSGERPA